MRLRRTCLNPSSFLVNRLVPPRHLLGGFLPCAYRPGTGQRRPSHDQILPGAGSPPHHQRSWKPADDSRQEGEDYMSLVILNDTRKPAVACLGFDSYFRLTLLFSCIHPGRIETFPESPHICFPVHSPLRHHHVSLYTPPAPHFSPSLFLPLFLSPPSRS